MQENSLREEFFQLIEGEPPEKRLRLMENAYFNPQFNFPSKKSLILRWILDHNDNAQLLTQCLGSSDVTNEEILEIIEILLDRPFNERNVSAILENRQFQQYFKHQPDKYCQLVAKYLVCDLTPKTLMSHPQLFSKFITAGEEFYRAFLDIIVPVFLKTNEFQEDFIGIVQKSLIQGNMTDWQNHLDGQIESKLPEDVLNFIKTNLKFSQPFFKAFCESFNADVSFRLLTILFQYFHGSDRLSYINDFLDVCNFTDTIFTDFFRNLVKQIITDNVIDKNVIQIIIKLISINPLIIEPISSDLVTFIFSKFNKKHTKLHNELLKAIIEVFAKLHRLESFFSKLIPSLKKVIQATPPEGVSADQLLSEDVQELVGTCLVNLASWQVINVFKTAIFHLKAGIEEYGSGVFDKDTNSLIYLEILGNLTCTLLQSTKIADHTTTQSVVDKFLKCLEETREILRNFASSILQREHNRTVMRTFLNLSYNWAEIYMTLAFYRSEEEIKLNKKLDSQYIGSNLTYLHNYMNVKEWGMVVQRISNFGEYPCKKMLQKFYIQKLRAMLVFESVLNEDITANLVKNLQIHLDSTWQDILTDKFAVNHLIPKMDKQSLTLLSEKLLDNHLILGKGYIKDNMTLTKATLYNLMHKVVKLGKGKRKLDSGGKLLSQIIFDLIPEEVFFTNDKYDLKEVFRNIEYVLKDGFGGTGMKVKEEKVLRYMEALKHMTLVFCNEECQILGLLWFLGLRMDAEQCSDELKIVLECFIIGFLQTCKFPLTEVLPSELLAKIVLCFSRRTVSFSLMTDNIFKNESSIKSSTGLIELLLDNLHKPEYLEGCIVVLHNTNKVKKSKMSLEIKEVTSNYKNQILEKLSNHVCETTSSIEAYATCLQHHFNLVNSSVSTKLLEKLDYFTLKALKGVDAKGAAKLFTVILQNKSKIDNFKTDRILDIWKCCKNMDNGPDYSHLINLIITLIGIEQFEELVRDLYEATIEQPNIQNLKLWQCILSCDVNTQKMKVWQEFLENLFLHVLSILKKGPVEADLSKTVVQLKLSIVQNQHFILSPAITDMLIMTPTSLLTHNFEITAKLSLQLLENLLKFRNPLIMDRLPAFLQNFRLILHELAKKSNADKPDLDVKVAADLAHILEKFVKHLVGCKKDMSRIAVFLVADVLEVYEKINLYPNVKLHLNNCIYSLMSLCDHHAVSYLMRNLSNASTEMFKIMFEHYKRYYRFTGKV